MKITVFDDVDKLTPAEKEKLIATTLKWCNSQRALKNMPPLPALPKGLRNNSESCPCGKATGLSVGYIHFNERGKPGDLTDDSLRLPLEVGRFAMHFDAGEFPELEETQLDNPQF